MKILFLCIGWTLAVAFFTLWLYGGYIEGPENREKLISVIEGKAKASKVLSVAGAQGAHFEGRFPLSEDHFVRVVFLAGQIRAYKQELEWARRDEEHEKIKLSIVPTVPDLKLSPAIKADVLARVTEEVQKARDEIERAELELEKNKAIARMEILKMQIEHETMERACEKEELNLKLQEISNKQLAAEIEELKLFAEKQKLTKESGLKKK